MLQTGAAMLHGADMLPNASPIGMLRETSTSAPVAELFPPDPWAAGRLADSPALYSTADPGAVAAAQQRWGAGAVAAAIETFLGAVAVLAVAGGVQRLVVGGGETSGAVVSALGLRSFVIGPEIAPGVPALQAEGELRLVLKSGNFGGQDFYRDALSVLYAPLR